MKVGWMALKGRAEGRGEVEVLFFNRKIECRTAVRTVKILLESYIVADIAQE